MDMQADHPCGPYQRQANSFTIRMLSISLPYELQGWSGPALGPPDYLDA